jgi:hypothetical protein
MFGWPMDHLSIHLAQAACCFLLLMISDPRTSPIIQLQELFGCVNRCSFIYLAAFKWKYNTIIWVLVAAAPLVPLLDKIFKAKNSLDLIHYSIQFYK